MIGSESENDLQLRDRNPTLALCPSICSGAFAFALVAGSPARHHAGKSRHPSRLGALAGAARTVPGDWLELCRADFRRSRGDARRAGARESSAATDRLDQLLAVRRFAATVGGLAQPRPPWAHQLR